MRDNLFSPKSWPYTIIFVIGGFLMIVFAFTDLVIAKWIYMPGNSFGEFLREYGEFPGHWLLVVAIIVVLIYTSSRIVKIIIIPLIALEIAISYEDMKDFTSQDLFIVVLLILPVTVVAFWGLSRLSREEKVNNSKYIVWTGLLYPLFLVQSIKVLWGRTRFKNMTNPEMEFTPWYLPQGITGEQSFPSGHTSMGIMLIFLTLYTPKQHKPVIFLLTLIWAVCVAISRMIVGAHFASDVTFSFFAGLIFYTYFSSRITQSE